MCFIFIASLFGVYRCFSMFLVSLIEFLLDYLVSEVLCILMFINYREVSILFEYLPN